MATCAETIIQSIAEDLQDAEERCAWRGVIAASADPQGETEADAMIDHEADDRSPLPSRPGRRRRSPRRSTSRLLAAQPARCRRCSPTPHEPPSCKCSRCADCCRIERAVPFC